jgi:hypothetical protein
MTRRGCICPFVCHSEVSESFVIPGMYYLQGAGSFVLCLHVTHKRRYGFCLLLCVSHKSFPRFRLLLCVTHRSLSRFLLLLCVPHKSPAEASFALLCGTQNPRRPLAAPFVWHTEAPPTPRRPFCATRKSLHEPPALHALNIIMYHNYLIIHIKKQMR